MIGIALSMMKILGIIVLAVILLLILAVVLVLFFPFVYRGRISYKDEADIDIRISWLFRFLNISFKYNKELKIVAKLAWFFKVYSNEEDEGEDLKEKVNDDGVEYEDSAEDKSDIKNLDSHNSVQGVVCQKETNPLHSHVDSKDKDLSLSEGSVKNEKKGILKKKSATADAYKKVSDLEKTERSRSKKINLKGKNTEGGRLKDISNRIKGFKAMIEDERNRELLFFLGDKTKKILKHILPKKIKGYIKFGFEDPSTTGQVLSGLAIFYPLYKDDFKITPMFFDEIFETDILFKKGIILSYVF